jgi:hypothetical protein
LPAALVDVCAVAFQKGADLVGNKLIPFAILAAFFFGGKMLLERQAQSMLLIAEEMYEDGEYDAALDKCREIDFMLSWTKAGKESLELREDIRKKIGQRDRGRADAASQRAFERQAESDRRYQERVDYVREIDEKALDELRQIRLDRASEQ